MQWRRRRCIHTLSLGRHIDVDPYVSKPLNPFGVHKTIHVNMHYFFSEVVSLSIRMIRLDILFEKNRLSVLIFIPGRIFPDDRLPTAKEFISPLTNAIQFLAGNDIFRKVVLKMCFKPKFKIYAVPDL